MTTWIGRFIVGALLAVTLSGVPSGCSSAREEKKHDPEAVKRAVQDLKEAREKENKSNPQQ